MPATGGPSRTTAGAIAAGMCGCLRDIRGFEVLPAKIPARAHGSVNWAMLADDGRWIGFDANHVLDLSDPELPADQAMRRSNAETDRIIIGRFALGAGPGIRTQAYMEDQCRRLCEQAAEAAR